MRRERLFLMMIASCVLTVVLSTHCSEYDLFELASLAVYCLCNIGVCTKGKGEHGFSFKQTRTNPNNRHWSTKIRANWLVGTGPCKK